MRPSENPKNQDWARRVVLPFIRRFPQYRCDIESEALLWLVKAETHPNCPEDGDEFQKFAYRFVRGNVSNFVRAIYRYRKRFRSADEHSDLSLALAPEDPPSRSEWAEVRLKLASHLKEEQSDVFLWVYGIESHQTFDELAINTGLPLNHIKRQHNAAMEKLRDLPSLRQVA